MVFLLVTVPLFLNGYLLEQQLHELQANLRSTDQLRVVQSNSAQIADGRIVDNFAGVRCPSWIPDAPFSLNNEVPVTPFVVHAPLGEIEDLQLRFADVRVLKSIATFRHLQRLRLVRLRTQSHSGLFFDTESLQHLQKVSTSDWDIILQRPLTVVHVDGCGVPVNTCQLLAERGTVKWLTIVNELGLTGVSNLSKCQELEKLAIGDIQSLEDDDVRDGVSKCLGLKSLTLEGSEIGSEAVTAACTLPSSEELCISTSMADANIYSALKDHQALKWLAVVHPSAGSVVIENAASIPTLKILTVSRKGTSKEQVASFETMRPTLSCTLSTTSTEPFAFAVIIRNRMAFAPDQDHSSDIRVVQLSNCCRQ
jgi:hypothetical protein